MRRWPKVPHDLGQIPNKSLKLAEHMGSKSGGWVILALVLADVLALEASLLLAYLVRQALGFLFPAKVPLEGLAPLALALLLFPLGYALACLYPGYGLPAVERMRRKVKVTFLLYLALIAWNWIFSQEDWSRSVLLMAMGFSLVLVPLGGTLVRELLARLGLWGVPVLVLGAGKTGALVVRKLKEDGVLGLRPVALLDDDPAKWGMEVEGVPVLGGLDQAEDLRVYWRTPRKSAKRRGLLGARCRS
jgi:FlaA1/EpsC-like NDP-sugar epimerase